MIQRSQDPFTCLTKNYSCIIAYWNAIFLLFENIRTIEQMEGFVLNKIIILFFLIMFFIGTDTFIVSPLLPILRESFGISIEQSGWIVSAYALGYALFALIAGPLSDAWNRKKYYCSACLVSVSSLYFAALPLIFGPCLLFAY